VSVNMVDRASGNISVFSVLSLELDAPSMSAWFFFYAAPSNCFGAG
jgi:hypothetical protein